MNIWQMACVAWLLITCSTIHAGSPMPVCVNLSGEQELYAMSNEYFSLIFIDNAVTKDERDQKRSVFMGEEAFTEVSLFIMRQALVIDNRATPQHVWHWGEGYSMWVQEEFVCPRKRPPVYDLYPGRYREAFF